MDWWIRVNWQASLFEPRLNNLFFLSIGANHRQASCALSVETKVFREWLRKHHSIVILGQLLQRISIFSEVIATESLVRRVKEYKMFFLFDDVKNLFPLLLGWINSRRILTAGLNKQDLLIIHFLKILQHTLNIETFWDRVKIPKSRLLKATILNNIVM